MAFDLDKLKGIVGAVAPMAATLLGGPLAGTAIKALSQTLLNKDDGTDEEVYEALATADPATLARVKETDNKLEAELAKAGVEREKIHQEDRGSARKMQEAMKSWAPAVIATVIFIGFFATGYALIFKEIPAGNREPLLIMLGVLGSIVVQVVNFWFGSSKGSKEKTLLIRS